MLKINTKGYSLIAIALFLATGCTALVGGKIGDAVQDKGCGVDLDMANIGGIHPNDPISLRVVEPEAKVELDEEGEVRVQPDKVLALLRVGANINHAAGVRFQIPQGDFRFPVRQSIEQNKPSLEFFADVTRASLANTDGSVVKRLVSWGLADQNVAGEDHRWRRSDHCVAQEKARQKLIAAGNKVRDDESVPEEFLHKTPFSTLSQYPPVDGDGRTLTGPGERSISFAFDDRFIKSLAVAKGTRRAHLVQIVYIQTPLSNDSQNVFGALVFRPEARGQATRLDLVRSQTLHNFVALDGNDPTIFVTVDKNDDGFFDPKEPSYRFDLDFEKVVAGFGDNKSCPFSTTDEETISSNSVLQTKKLVTMDGPVSCCEVNYKVLKKGGVVIKGKELLDDDAGADTGSGDPSKRNVVCLINTNKLTKLKEPSFGIGSVITIADPKPDPGQ